MKKLGIPDVPGVGHDRQRFDEALKVDMEVLMGRRGGKIAPLPTTATTADIIAKINEMLDVIQG